MQAWRITQTLQRSRSQPSRCCLCSFWRLTLTSLVLTLALACHPSKRNKDFLPDHMAGNSPALAGSQFALPLSFCVPCIEFSLGPRLSGGKLKGRSCFLEPWPIRGSTCAQKYLSHELEGVMCPKEEELMHFPRGRGKERVCVCTLEREPASWAGCPLLSY